MAEQGGTVRWIIEADDSQFNQTLQNASQSAQQFSKTLDGIDTNVKVFDKSSQGILGLAKSFIGLNESANQTSGMLKQLGSSLGSVAWNTFTTGAGAAATALTTLVTKGIQSADFLETTQTAMSGLTGSMEEGSKAMSIAANYWQNNPFQRVDVTSATKQLVQFGRTTGQIGKDLEILGNVSLSTGADISELARYYSRVSASGRAMTMDLEMMSDRGIPIYRELGEVTGKTTEQVRKMASEGKISFDIFKQAMENAVDPEAMAQYENTLSRQVDRLKGSINILAGELAGYGIINDELVIKENGLTKATTRLSKALADGLRSDKMKQSLAKLGEAITPLIDKITDKVPAILESLGKAMDFISNHTSTLIPILGGALVMFGQLGANLPGIGGIVSNLGRSFGSLTGDILGLAKANPILTTFIAIFAVGFADAYKNNEDFRKSIQKLFSSLGELAQTLTPVLTTMVRVFTSLAGSQPVVLILQGIAEAIALLAKGLSLIPSEVFVGIAAAIGGFMLLDTSPILFTAMAITTVVEAIKSLEKESHVFSNIGKSIGDFFNGFVNTIKGIIDSVKTAGHNVMVGLLNGLIEGYRKVRDFVTSVAKSIVSTFKKVLQIHSPSKVMQELGNYTTLGLAKGIEAGGSVAKTAMNNLANDIIKTAEKVIANKVDFNVIDINGQYKEWKKVSKLFTVGSQQYETAIEKMEEARKSANLQIIKLQETYNDKLDDTIDRISTMYSTFEDVDLSGGKNASQILKTMDQQLAKMQEYSADQEIIAGLKLDPKFIEELQKLGVESTAELSAIAQMTTDELSQLNTLWLQKQSVATKTATQELSGFKDETLNQISQLKDGIDGEMVDVKDVGGRLVTNISEGVTGALPTLEQAWSQIGDYIAAAQNDVAKSTADATNSIGESYEDLVDDGKDTKDAIAATMDGINAGVEKFSKYFIAAIAGIGVAIAAKKIIPKLVGSIAGKSSGTLSSVLSSLKIGDAAKVATENASKAKDITKSTTTLGSEMTKTGTEVTKVNSTLNTIKQGAQTIIWIAGAIAAMALAIRVAYEALKDVDWVGFASAMGQVAVAIGAFGLLAFGVDKLGVSAKSIAIIIGLAADLAVMALAVRVAYEALVPVDWASFGRILGEVSATIGALGILAGALGYFAGFEALGILVIIGLAVDLAAMATSLRLAYDALQPVDWASFGRILGEVSATIGALGVLAGVLGAFAPFEAAGVLIILGLAEDLRQIALSLALTNAVLPDDLTALNNKLAVVKKTIGVMGILGGVIGVFAPVENAGVNAIKGLASAVISVANALQRMYAAIPDDLGGVLVKFQMVENIIERISNTNMGNVLKNITKSWSADKIVNIIDDYVKIAEKLPPLAHAINMTEGIETGHAATKINEIRAVITEMGKITDPGGLADKEYVVGMAASIAYKLGEFSQAVRSIGDDDKTGIVSNAIQALTNLFSGISESLAPKLADIEALGQQMGDKFKDGILSKEADITNAGVSMQSFLWNGIESKMEDEYQQGAWMAQKFVDGLKSINNKLQEAGNNAQTNFWWGVQNKMEDEYSQGQAMGYKFRQGLYDVDYANAGWWASQGFINGANNRAYSGDGVYHTGWWIANTFLQGLKDRGNQGSPWKTTMQSGAWAAEGLVKGIESGENAVVGAANNLADKVIDALDMSDITMSPELDARVGVAPSVFGDDENSYYARDRRNVVIEQTNNNYTNYSLQAVNRDLRWELSKV